MNNYVRKTKRFVWVGYLMVMVCLGVYLYTALVDISEEARVRYEKCVKINNDTSLFRQSLEEGIGDSFIYGTISAVDPIEDDVIGGEWLYLRVETMERHAIPTKIDKTTVITFSWNEVDSKTSSCKEFELLGETFPLDRIILPKPKLIETVHDENSSDIRYDYYGIPEQIEGTLYTSLKEGNISKDSKFYIDERIEDAIEEISSGSPMFVFLCILVVATIIIGFVLLILLSFLVLRT